MNQVLVPTRYPNLANRFGGGFAAPGPACFAATV
jgi:hypothetical protein